MGGPTQSGNDNLTVRDNRTGKVYTIPIGDNAVSATAFKAMIAPRKPGEREENETEKGLRVQDKGFLNTAVIRSEITYIDGEAGVLRYRGYPIEQLAVHSSHLETAYLLIYGALPTKEQFGFFQSEVLLHSVIHSDAEGFFRSFRYDAHPMSMLTSAFAMLGSYYSEANPSLQGQRLYTKGDKISLATMDRQIYRLIGKATTLAAMAYRIRQGRDFVTPPTGLSYTGSFLYQMDHLGEENYVPNPVLEKALDVLFLLHADHELNASCTTVLQTGSSLVDPYSAVAAGCASLYGPLHGGANEAVIRMLISIGRPENVPAFIEAVKRREKTLSGFGHRVYKTSDPRSFIVRKTADEVFKVTGKDELLETAMALHDAAMKDEYFVKRKLAPNVDFCGLIYRAMGFPLDFFPVLFVVPRVVGWLAHWRQMMLQEGGVKIWRPRQVYVGAGRRDYVPLEQRPGVQDARQTPSAVEHGGITKRSMLASFEGKARL
ncbi:peroxisomal citrate synthase [Sparassis crispa]|uniref:Citrate synthase n=1 Tax=Sparassis crispa TaxID=139825 RepID=A0A401H0S0_9APHY|nr:peroxisomal citrate synthase [Sparassis crispa]GBE87979.1 peroxisomal citrate synthase [Sparassis crispa]